MLLSVENTAFCRKNFKNSGKNSYNARVQAQKHRTSLTQTSVLSRQNIRTLWQRSPMFPLFRPEMAQKSPFSDFAMFRDKARRGDFRSPSQPVNDGGRGGYRHRTNVRRKILHTPFNDPESLAFNDMESLPFSAGHWGVFCTFFTVETDKKRKKQGGMKVFFCTFAPIVTH